MSNPQKEKVKRKPREITFAEALILLVVFVAILVCNAQFWGMGTAMGLLYAAVVALLYGILVLGHSWKSLFDAALKVCGNCMPVMYILFMCGILQAGWLMSGTVPYIIFLGLKLIRPEVFLLVTFIVCFAGGVVTGNGWAMIATLGLALVSVGNALGIPMAYSVGAIVGGCMTGDRWSPMVDTFNLCSALSGSKVTKQWSSMIPTTAVGFVLSCVLYLILGFTINVDAGADLSNITYIITTLESSYRFNALLVAPLVLVIVLVLLKVDPVPAFFASALLGVVEGCIFQGINFWEGSAMLWNGYVANTGDAAIDELLSLGGLMGNVSLIMLLFVAFVFAGCLNHMGILRVLLSGVVSKLKNSGNLVLACTLTSLAGVFISTSVFVSAILNAEIYKSAFRQKKLAPEVLGRTLVEGVAHTSCYVPWSGGGILVTSTLLAGVWTWSWLPFCFAGWIPAVVNIVFAYLNINMPTAEYDEDLNLIESEAEPVKT